MYVMSYLGIPGSLLFLWLSHLDLLGRNLDKSVSKTINWISTYEMIPNSTYLYAERYPNTQPN